MRKTTAKLRECRWRPKLVSFNRGELISGWGVTGCLSPPRVDPLVLSKNRCQWRVLWAALWVAEIRSCDFVTWPVLLRRIQHMKLEGWGKLLHYTKSSTPEKGLFWANFRVELGAKIKHQNKLFWEKKYIKKSFCLFFISDKRWIIIKINCGKSLAE